MLHTKESKNKCGKKINWEKNQAQPQLDGAKQQGDEISLMCSLLLKKISLPTPHLFCRDWSIHGSELCQKVYKQKSQKNSIANNFCN